MEEMVQSPPTVNSYVEMAITSMQQSDRDHLALPPFDQELAETSAGALHSLPILSAVDGSLLEKRLHRQQEVGVSDVCLGRQKLAREW